MDKSGLDDLKATDAENNTLKLDPWELSEITNISRCAAFQLAENGENFRLKDTDATALEDFKLSYAYTQMQHVQGDTTKTPPASL